MPSGTDEPARLVAAGPLPPVDDPSAPPIGGASRTFAAFLARCAEAHVGVRVIDTSPVSVPAFARRAYRPLVAIRLARLATRPAGTPVMWFLSEGMVRSLSPLVPLLARRGPVVLVGFGGLLGRAVAAAGGPGSAVARRLGAASAVFVQTEVTAEEARDAGVGSVAAYGGLRPPLPVEPRTGPPEAPRPQATVRLVYAGRITPSKGLDDLALLVDELASRGLRAEVRVAGRAEPNDRAWWDRLVARTDFVALGELDPDEVLTELRDADAAVLLSHYPGEGTPGVVLEALSLGTPVIVSRWRALGDLVADGVAGLVARPADGAPGPPWDLGELADRLVALGPDGLVGLRTGALTAPVVEANDTALGRLLDAAGVAHG